MGTKTCIKCGKGGIVLVCRSSKCLVSIHESCCMPSSLQVHDRENFLCPYCLYKQSVAECRQAKDKALLAEKNLALFLGAKSSVNQEHEPDITMDKSTTLQNHEELGNQERVRKNKERVCFQTEDDPKNGECSHVHVREMLSDEQASSSTPGKKGGYLRNCSIKPVENQKNRDGQICGNVPSKWEGKVLAVEPVSACRLSTPIHNYAYENQNFGKTQQHLKPLDPCNKEKGRVKLAEIDLIKRKTKPRREAGPCETAIFSISEGNRSEIYEESDSVSETYTYCNDRSELYSRLARESIENAFKFKNYSPGKACDPNSVITGDVGWIDKPSKEILSGAFCSRRKRVRWTTEEEEMLMKGVLVFSSSVKKNLPWRKILEFGSNVFHQSRTPLDLQSKWKIISRKKSEVK